MEADQEKFARFWSKYPRKVGKGKCETIWKKLKVSNAVLESILGALEAQSKSRQWKRNDGEFIPFPSTWLAQKRWQDEPDNWGGGDKQRFELVATCICCKAPYIDGKRSCKCVLMLSGQHNFCPIHEGKCRVCCGCEPVLGKEPF